MTPLPWSFSALSDFLNCPKAYYRKRIAKDVIEAPNEAGAWGDYVHKELDKYLKSEGSYELPSNVAHYKQHADQFVGMPGSVLSECRYAINRSLHPCDFFDSGVWCRGIIDVLVLDPPYALATDHKTGKRKLDSNQLKLCALLVFAHHPEIETCLTRFDWLKEGVQDREVYHRKDETEMWATFVPSLTQYVQAFKDETFNPRPSGLCYGWCPVTDCEYWKPKR